MITIVRKIEKLNKILLAEDSDIITRIIVHKLEKENYSIVRLATGEKVYETALSLNPDLLILDLLLPIRNGLTILRDLKSNPSTTKIPIIIFTTNNNEEMLQSALDLGAVDFILKPFSTSELTAKVKKYTNF